MQEINVIGGCQIQGKHAFEDCLSQNSAAPSKNPQIHELGEVNTTDNQQKEHVNKPACKLSGQKKQTNKAKLESQHIQQKQSWNLRTKTPQN